MDAELHGRLDELQRDPYPHYARARAAEGLTYVPELDSWLVARDADVREVLRRPEDFSSANALRPDVMPAPAALAVLGGGFGGRPVVVTADGTLHQELRAPLVRGLSPARVAAVLPYAEERAAALIDGFVEGGRVELMSAYAGRLPGEVVGRLVGFEPEDVPALVRAGHRAERLLFRPMTEAEQIAAAEDVVAAAHRLDAFVRARHADPREDLGTELIRSVVGHGTDAANATATSSATDASELTLDHRHQVVSHPQNLLIAGHLTTTALIGTTLLHLLRDRRQWELLCAEPERIPAAVEEAARHDTALQGFRRVTTRPVTLSGTELPAGTPVFLAFGSANRDGSRHPRPDDFDITRPAAGRHLSFGLGAHACPGSQLAREQLRITLRLLTSRLPGLRLAEDQRITMRPTLIHRAPERLDLVW
ncbi:cytochrome P450 [Streptomyces scabiei]|uniref:cytochrome P450 n=1 Tax=Streptomyces scabiei TaxID=1930 RepID=UPI0004E70FE9|nr:cytochrome P450 [Streptomyces scabiei]KFG09387.1 cytochrome P450 [Streptomyces scabiei]MDX2830269.1 cytochrome P450 [Streptomyces scabiei]MDX3676394.1 cytochrome P450 [Streptomyces scabiei]